MFWQVEQSVDELLASLNDAERDLEASNRETISVDPNGVREQLKKAKVRMSRGLKLRVVSFMESKLPQFLFSFSLFLWLLAQIQALFQKFHAFPSGQVTLQWVIISEFLYYLIFISIKT